MGTVYFSACTEHSKQRKFSHMCWNSQISWLGMQHQQTTAAVTTCYNNNNNSHRACASKLLSKALLSVIFAIASLLGSALCSSTMVVRAQRCVIICQLANLRSVVLVAVVVVVAVVALSLLLLSLPSA